MITLSNNIDSYCDRYTRMFMVVVFAFATFSMLIEYFTNRIKCTEPYEGVWRSDIDKEYIDKLCWSSGLFLYREAILRYEVSDSFSYGIPPNPTHNGLRDFNKYCFTQDVNGGLPDEKCMPMRRVYFKHFIWLPFYIGLLTLLFYFPYTVFKIVNPDLYSLITTISSRNNDNNAFAIIRNYFDYAINPISRLRLRVWLNIMVKILYLVVNIFAFAFTSYLLGGNYDEYGTNFRMSNKDENESIPKKVNPGTAILPTTGLCEISAYMRPRSGLKTNLPHILICQVPANSFYQYILLLLWLLLISGITVSVIGLTINIGNHMYRFLCYGNDVTVRRIYSFITLREIEYLVLVKKKDVILYGEIMRLLKEMRTDDQGKFLINDEEKLDVYEEDAISSV